MDFCDRHNVNGYPDAEKRFGVRVVLTGADPLKRLLGDFERTHWFVTRTQRDRALADMQGEHLYSRRGDRPTLRFETVDRT